MPSRPSVSYSTGETTSLPAASAYTLLHWITLVDGACGVGGGTAQQDEDCARAGVAKL